MSFGRQKNMVRRASRPDESHHRSLRRRSIDRSVMLNSAPRRPSFLERMIRSLARLLRGR